jgi:hypothetical protein
MIVAIATLVPAAFMPVPVMISIVIAFMVARTRDHASGGKGDEAEKDAASKQAL